MRSASSPPPGHEKSISPRWKLPRAACNTAGNMCSWGANCARRNMIGWSHRLQPSRRSWQRHPGERPLPESRTGNLNGASMSVSENMAETESAATLAGRIRRKELSLVEVVESAIARIEKHNPVINALVIFGFDDARKAAKAA